MRRQVVIRSIEPEPTGLSTETVDRSESQERTLGRFRYSAVGGKLQKEGAGFGHRRDQPGVVIVLVIRLVVLAHERVVIGINAQHRVAVHQSASGILPSDSGDAHRLGGLVGTPVGLEDTTTATGLACIIFRFLIRPQSGLAQTSAFHKSHLPHQRRWWVMDT